MKVVMGFFTYTVALSMLSFSELLCPFKYSNLRCSNQALLDQNSFSLFLLGL